MFKYFDMDGNGKIDSYEFICALALMAHGTLAVNSLNYLLFRKKQSLFSLCTTSMEANTYQKTNW